MKKRKPLLRVLAWLLVVAMIGTGMPSQTMVSAKRKPKLNRTRATIRVGKTVKLRVKYASRKTKVKWSSSKKKVATVTKKGLVRGKKAGKAVIKAKVGKRTLRCRVTVRKKKSSVAPTIAPTTATVPQTIVTPLSQTTAKPGSTTIPTATVKTTAGATDTAAPSSQDTAAPSVSPAGDTPATTQGAEISSASPDATDSVGNQTSTAAPKTTDAAGKGETASPSATATPFVTVDPSTWKKPATATPVVELKTPIPGVTEKPGVVEVAKMTFAPEEETTAEPEETDAPTYNATLTTTVDGKQSAVSGVTFAIKKSGEDAVISGSQASDGKITFDDLEAGTYEVWSYDSTGASKVDTWEIGEDGVSLTLSYYSVVFYLNAGSSGNDKVDGIDTQYILKGQKATEPDSTLIGYSGLSFLTWTTSVKTPLAKNGDAESAKQEGYSFDTAVTGQTNLYAYWQTDPNVVACTVTCYDETNSKTIKTVTLSGKAGTTVSAPEIAGYTVASEDASITLNSNASLKINYTPVTYTIQWKEGTVKVGSVSPLDGTKSTSILHYGESIVSPDITAPTGYELAGWTRTNADGETETLLSGQTMAALTETTITYTAQWTPIEYTITYELGGGTATNPKTYTIEDTLTLRDPSRTGYAFVGWTLSGSTDVSDTVKITNETGDKTYIAKWKTAYYVRHWLEDPDQTKETSVYNCVLTETFEADEGTTVSPVVKTDGIYANYIAPDVSTTKGKVTNTDDGNLVFDLYYTCHTTTLHWDLNGGTSATGEKIITIYQVRYGLTMAAYQVGDELSAKPGYTLKYWKGSDGSTLSLGESFTMPYIKDGELTYTAVWEANTDTPYYIVYHKEKVGGNETEFDTETEELTGTTDTTVTKTAPSAEGFTLRGDSTGEKSLTIDGNGESFLEFYYLRDDYTVTWKLNGGTIDGSSDDVKTTVEYGEVITPPTTPVKEGYEFKEWQDKDAQVLESGAVKGVGDATYTAQWKGAGGIKYTVNYYKQNLDDNDYTLADTVTDTGTTGEIVTVGTKTYTGFTLRSDSAADDKKLTIKADGSAVKNYYYDRNVYTVTFDLGGGTYNGSTDDVVYKQRYEAKIVPPSGVTREGYSFSIWTSNNGTPAIGANESTPSRTVTSDITFTPSWSGDATSYTVLHKKQNADNDNYTTAQTVSVTKNVTVGDVITPETLTYDGFAAPEKQTFTATAEKTTITYLYNRLSYNLTIELDGGKFSSTSFTDVMSVRQGSTVKLPTTSDVTKDGYTLDYWVFNNGTTETQVQPGGSVTMPIGAATLTAYWYKGETTSSGDEGSGTTVTTGTEQLVLKNKATSMAKYAFYIGQSLDDVKELDRFSGEDGEYWNPDTGQWSKYVRIDKSPQGFDIYAFKGDDGPFDEGHYFQLYVQDNVIVGMATISPYFTYQSSDGSTTYLQGKSATMGSADWQTMSSKYRYQNAKYAHIGNAYVVAFVDTYDGNGKCVYGTQVFSDSFDVDDILLTSQIQSKYGYSDEVLEDMSLELEEWARAYRFYRYTGTSNETFAVTNDNEDYIYTEMPLAKIHAKYEAADKSIYTETYSAERTYLNNNYGFSLGSSDTSMAKRFTGYMNIINKKSGIDYGETCYTSGELTGSGSPDALGFLTWWVDGGTEDQEQYTTSLLKTLNTADNETLSQSSLHMVGGVANTSSGNQYTYATLDIFSLY